MSVTALARVSKKIGGSGHPYKRTKVDEERVKNLVLLGTPEEAIAQCIGESGINVLTLRNHYGDLLVRFRNEMLGKIASSAYKWALDEADGGAKGIPHEVRSRMKMFVLKTRAGWRETDPTIINADKVLIVKRIVGVDEAEL